MKAVGEYGGLTLWADGRAVPVPLVVGTHRRPTQTLTICSLTSTPTESEFMMTDDDPHDAACDYLDFGTYYIPLTPESATTIFSKYNNLTSHAKSSPTPTVAASVPTRQKRSQVCS